MNVDDAKMIARLGLDYSPRDMMQALRILAAEIHRLETERLSRDARKFTHNFVDTWKRRVPDGTITD